MNFAVFPTDKGSSVSTWVSQVVAMVRESGFRYQMNSMGTVVETTTMAEAVEILDKAINLLAADSNRLYCTATFDIKHGDEARIDQKIASVENKIGRVDR